MRPIIDSAISRVEQYGDSWRVEWHVSHSLRTTYGGWSSKREDSTRNRDGLGA